MPEDCLSESDLARVLDDLEDYSLNGRNYLDLLNILDSVDHITAPIAEKLLLLCIRDRIEDLKYTTLILKVISSLLKKIKDGQCTPLPNLVPSALAVLDVLNTTAQCDELEVLTTLCFEIINTYPDEILISLCENHSNEIFKIVDLYSHQGCILPTQIRLQPVNIIGKLLRILPPDKKGIFLKDGMNIWFSAVIPLVVGQIDATTGDVENNILEALELLTDELVQFDYIKNSSWLQILENIHTPSRYPTILKRLLEKGSAYWHRLWIIFIKLLKSQITKCTNTTASPINALLPCVEMAFKMDVANRCRAFLCWNALIENFSKESNEAFLNKRLKLLMVPLASNNAKVEETALAKLKTWWCLITRFQAKLDKFLEAVVMPFLIFCFGKPTASVLIPGKISDKTKVQCVQAFINIIGHAECDGCVDLPKLSMKLFNATLLVSHWKNWIHSLSNTIKICVEQNSAFTEQQIRCVWKSFILTIGELPENNIRRDLFNEAIILLDGLTLDCDNRLMGVIVNVLIPTLFNRHDKIQPMLMCKDEQNSPIHKIIAVLNKLPVDGLEDRETALESVQVLTDWLVDDGLMSSFKMECLVQTLSSNVVLVWTALAKSISLRMYSICPRLLSKMFLWPFQYMNNFVNKEDSTSAWLNLYETKGEFLNNSVHEDIIDALMNHCDNKSSIIFVLNATIAVIEHKLQQEDTSLDKEMQLILQLISEVNEILINVIFPLLARVIVHILNALNKNTNVKTAEYVMYIINNILKIFKVLCKKQSDSGNNVIKYIENIFSSLESTLKLDLYSKLKSFLIDQLKECAPYLKHHNALNKHILAIYMSSLNKNFADNANSEVVQAFEISKVPDSVNQTPKGKADAQNFSTPSGKNAKKSKKEVSITNTVMENGEEFVVVKSNWKFNPKKLTENQKEKLQRKREDIPAMYQDLSQSQDEFKLTTWKTDSQDTSTTSSKSINAVTKEEVTVMLKNIPKMFPKIYENVTTTPVTDVTQNTENNKGKLNVYDDNNKKNNVQTTGKGVKSPRMKLKDRVFRNVRNLIEKPNLDQECSDLTENILKTPIIAKVKPSINLANSEPSQINSERPSRVRRKPKKFDDLHLISLTKRRHSIIATESQNDEQNSENSICNSIENSKDIKIQDKANVDNQGLVGNFNDNSKLTKGDVNILGVEIDKMEETVTLTNITIDISKSLKAEVNTEELIKTKTEERALTNCSVEIENLNLTNDAVKNILENEKKISDNKKEPMTLVSNIEITGTISNTCDLKKNKKSEDSIITNNLRENICTVTLEQPVFTPKSNKSEDKVEVEEKKSTDSENKSFCTPKPKGDDLNEINTKFSDESKLNAVFMTTNINKNETIKDRFCNVHTHNSNVSLSNDNIQKVKENEGERKCFDDTTSSASIPEATDNISTKRVISNKKSNRKKSRIESQLAIDMVEGHPFLKAQSEKRSRRNAMSNSPLKRRRLSFNQENKLKKKATIIAENKLKDRENPISISKILFLNSPLKRKRLSFNQENKPKRKATIVAENKLKVRENSISNENSSKSEDIGASQDYIESSQDSAITTISAKSSKPLASKNPVVVLEEIVRANNSKEPDTQDLINVPVDIDLTNIEDNSDIVLPNNKTMLTNLTEEMDTEPMDYNDEVIIIEDDPPSSAKSEVVSLDLDVQNTAEANTEPVDPTMFLETNVANKLHDADQNTQISDEATLNQINDKNADIIIEKNETNASLMTTAEDITKTLSESLLMEVEKDDSSTSSDNEKRKKSFLNDTLQISPIRSMSPIRDEKSPSPETSSDYVVITLASPVQSNGQPFEICESPEIFTEDKLSPDMRDRSPPREEFSVKNTSPSSSLSLKKNRPQMRPGGRAAQMLGLCVPDRLQTMMPSAKPTEPEEEPKRSPSLNISAKRNLRILYNTTGDGIDTSNDTDDSESFLKFKRTLPTSDCSPSGPILKRKLIDITDESTASPASKRKRVSFHDPPVSTTICVNKYIEPIGIRSPQNSAIKRLERQARAQTAVKSPRRLENAFKLDSILTKAVESFSDTPETETMNEDTEISSLDETPVVEVVKTSDLNDTDPICKELVDCEDPIAKIAEDLSSPAMKALLVKKFEGLVNTVGDLAKMTELEVNRLCIKAPKVQVAKKVLNEYLSKHKQVSEEIISTVESTMCESTVLDAKASIEIQTDSVLVGSVEVQTDLVSVALASSQTVASVASHSFVQTDESGSKSTVDIITDCLSERPDFVERLCETMDETSKQKIIENSSYEMLINILMDKASNGDGKHVLSILQDQLVQRFECKDLILFCSSLLKNVYDKPT